MDVVEMLLGENAVRLAGWLHQIASGMGLRSIGGNIATIYRHIKSAVNLIYEFLEHNFLESCIKLPNDSKMPLKFGREWEWDEKVISVTERFSGYPYSHKTKGKKVIRETIVSSIIDLKTHAVLASEVVGTASASDLKLVLDKALRRTGFRKVSIRVDGASAHKQAVKLSPNKLSLIVLPKKGGRSQLNCIEGFHAYMDRKLRSGIHGRDP
ncbi:MAG: hypothetical protein NDP22_00315 [Crenarchaeota archaeon]|nr:hypothetical protein [Thermoproteota archaeon]